VRPGYSPGVTGDRRAAAAGTGRGRLLPLQTPGAAAGTQTTDGTSALV